VIFIASVISQRPLVLTEGVMDSGKSCVRSHWF